jgi:ribosomal-protein-serine acetyltransferase
LKGNSTVSHLMEYIQVNNEMHLEAITLSAAPVVFEAIARNREFLRKWLPFVDATQSVSDTELFIRSLVWQKENKKDEVFTIWYKLEFAGLIGFKDTDWVNHKTELGYWLIENMQGKGIITQCTTTLIKYAFKKLRMNRIQIKVANGNTRSAAVPNRLGFNFEGIEQQGEWLNGTYHDLQIFSLLKSDKSPDFN